MSIDAYENLCDLVRDLLGDTDQPGGDVFSNSEIQQAFTSAWDELIGMMGQDQIPTAKRIVFHNLPAYTSVLLPAAAAITDMDEPVMLEERIPGTTHSIASVDAGTGNAMQIHCFSHGITSPTEVQISDVLGVPANGRWFASVVDSNTLLLSGSQFSGAYVSGGTLTTSADEFTKVDQQEILTDRPPDLKLLEFVWRENAYQFVGATQAIQLRITYFSSGAAPQSGSLIYGGIKQPLAYRAAALLAYKHGRGQGEADRLDVEARGPNKDGFGGHYFRFLQPLVRRMQQTPLRRPVRPPDHLTDIYSPW